jgi:hypothetical protein
MSMLRAKEAPDFLVDTNNGSMLNTNTNALDAYKRKRDYDRKMMGMVDRVERLEQNIGEIQSLLKILIERT